MTNGRCLLTQTNHGCRRSLKEQKERKTPPEEKQMQAGHSMERMQSFVPGQSGQKTVPKLGGSGPISSFISAAHPSLSFAFSSGKSLSLIACESLHLLPFSFFLCTSLSLSYWADFSPSWPLTVTVVSTYHPIDLHQLPTQCLHLFCHLVN